MVRRRRGGRGVIDRDIYIFAAIVLIVGLTVGFFLGRRSVEMTKWPKKTQKPRVLTQAVTAPTQKSTSSFFFPFRKKTVPIRIAIVIDDVGNSNDSVSLLWQFPQPVTLAILPQLPKTEYFSREGKKRGFEIILHQPMEPLREVQADDIGMIRTDMDDDAIRETLRANLRTVSSAIGVNNHKGSFATQDRRVMDVLFQELKKRDMFFLDSATTQLSVAEEEAARFRVPYLRRAVFLDNEADPNYIHGQLDHLVDLAERNGSAVGIGHYKYETLVVLKDELSKLRNSGVEIVPLKKLL